MMSSKKGSGQLPEHISELIFLKSFQGRGHDPYSPPESAPESNIKPKWVTLHLFDTLKKSIENNTRFIRIRVGTLHYNQFNYYMESVKNKFQAASMLAASQITCIIIGQMTRNINNESPTL